MKRSTFTIALVLTLLLGVSAASAQIDQKASPQHHASAKPKLTCSIKGIVFSAAKVTLAPKSGCYFGKKAAPSTGKWTAKSYDITATPATGTLVAPTVQPCYFGTGTGPGKSFNAPSPLQYILGAPKYGYPSLYQVSFTLSGRWGKQKVSVTKTALKRTPSSNILCGPPPKMTSFSGVAGGCVWTQFPALGTYGLSTQNAKVGCPSGNGTCLWQKDHSDSVPPFLVFGYGFKCSGGYEGHLAYQLGYSSDGKQTCLGPPVQRASLYPLQNFGPGSIYIYAYVLTVSGGGYVDSGQMNVKPTYWWGTNWFPATGTTPPC